jgi:MFS family permease
MVVGSFAFAALRRVPLPGLLLASTFAVGAAYLATGAAPTLFVACLAAGIGGAGNGVQWVALMTAVQQLTSALYQARVISLLESLASAMPGLGFVIGGVVAALFNPRVSYAVAGAGVFGVLAIAAVSLRRADFGAGIPEEQEGSVPKPRPMAELPSTAETRLPVGVPLEVQEWIPR